eukprot:1143635-Pelagomonas_calceolata.AAC.5
MENQQTLHLNACLQCTCTRSRSDAQKKQTCNSGDVEHIECTAGNDCPTRGAATTGGINQNDLACAGKLR